MTPILETSRLALRHLEPDDVDAIYAIIGDDVAMRYYPQAFNYGDACQWVERNRQRYKDHGYGLFAVILKSSGNLIGDCGIVRQRIDGELALEVGYHFRRDQWGNGYATEAARACMGLAFHAFGADKVISLIRPENIASQRVAERNRMKLEREILHYGLPHLVYSMRREDYGQA